MTRPAVIVLLVLLLFLACAGLAAPAGAIPLMKNLTPSPLKVWRAAQDGNCLGVVAAPKGVAYVCGVEVRDGHGEDVVVRRVGSGEWTRYWDGAANGIDKAYDIVRAADGSLYVSGAAGTAHATRNAVLIKYSPRGKKRWVRQWAGVKSAGASAAHVVVTSKGHVVIAGETLVDDRQRVFAAKYTPAGKRLWVRVATKGASQYCDDACLGGGDAVYVSGRFEATTTSNPDGLIAKFTSAGKLAWMKTYDAVGAWDGFRAVCRRPAGGVYVAGTSETAVNDYDGIVVRYTGKGAQKVIVRSEPGDDAFTEFYDVTTTTDRKVAVCGAHAVGSSPASMIAAIYGDAGAETWYRSWASATGSSSARLIAARPDGAIVVSGYWERVGSVHDVMTYFVNRSGVRRARCEWAGHSPGEPTPEDVAVRGSSTWVVGRCQELVTGEDCFAMRLVP